MEKKPDLRKLGDGVLLKFDDHTIIMTKRVGRKFETRQVPLKDIMENNLWNLESYFEEKK